MQLKLVELQNESELTKQDLMQAQDLLQKVKESLEIYKKAAYKKKLGLISQYTVAQFNATKQKRNENPAKNELNREFNGQKPYAVVLSALTYVSCR